jgi:NAD(P)H-dependent FMN reductase
MPVLNIIIASTRPGRVGGQIGEWAAQTARAHGGFDVVISDLAEVALPFLDEPHHPAEGLYTQEHTRRWSAAVSGSDAFVFVMPEYNFGFTAPLKNAIDYLYDEWQYKPVAFVSYGMTSAGLRAVQMIKQVVTTLKMFPVTEAVSIPLRSALDEAGRFVPTPSMTTVAGGMLDELVRLQAALSTLRTPVVT